MDFKIILQFLLLVVGFVMLVKGADWFVEGTGGIARKLGIPQLVVGLTIVAMGTSAPEAAVSVASALKGNADISVGNVLGSNIMNVLVILGITAVIISITIEQSTVKCELPFMIFISVVFVIMGYTGGQITRTEGIVLWILFIAYLAYLFWSAKSKKEESEEVEKSTWLLIVLAIIGGAIVVWGSDVTVDAAVNIAKAFGVSERFIGLTIVALGTSLPELVTSVTAAKRGNAGLAVGNIVGSNIFNILFVIGTSALIVPIHYGKAFLIDGCFAIGAAVLLWIAVARRKELVRGWGIVLLLGYVGYFIYLVLQ